VVLGFGALTPYRSRPAYSTSVENSVYVDRAHRGAGVGRAVLEELIRLASDHGFHTVIARVVGENEASVHLHRSCGFEVVGVEREIGRKHGRWLDVIELQRML
jgi:phosphinothricin acetyltransferase